MCSVSNYVNGYSFHKSNKTKILIESKGNIIEFLPPYSSDLNMVVNKYTHDKSIKRKAGCDIEYLLKFYMM